MSGVAQCGDPECGGTATLEQDGDHCTYWACEECGFEFGYELISQQDETCQIGVPESIRRQASAAANAVFDDGKPILQIGRRPTDAH
jgi:hypothetical protein